MEVEYRIACALRAFGALRRPVFGDKDLSLKTKRSVCDVWNEIWGELVPPLPNRNFPFLCAQLFIAKYAPLIWQYTLLSKYTPLTQQYTPYGYNCREYNAESWVYMPYVTTYGTFNPPTHYS